MLSISAAGDVAANLSVNLAALLRRPMRWVTLWPICVHTDTLYVSAPVSPRPQPNLSFYILLSYERMERNGVSTLQTSDFPARHVIFLGRCTSSLMKWSRVVVFFFPHIYKWAFFMYSPGTACILKGFMSLWLYFQWGEPDLCCVVTYSIILRMIWNGWASWNWTVVVCSRAICQSTGDERSQWIASRLL